MDNARSRRRHGGIDWSQFACSAALALPLGCHGSDSASSRLGAQPRIVGQGGESSRTAGAAGDGPSSAGYGANAGQSSTTAGVAGDGPSSTGYGGQAGETSTTAGVAGDSPSSAGYGGQAGETSTTAGVAGEVGLAGSCASLSFEAPKAGAQPTRYAPPTRWILGPVFGAGCPLYGECEVPGFTMAEQAAYDLDKLSSYDIPITVYHFDGEGWSNDGNCGWNLGETLKTRLRDKNIRALLHFWGCCAQDQPCETLDLGRLYGDLGSTLGGIYLDDRQVQYGRHNGATDVLAKNTVDWLQLTLPGDAEVVMKGNRGEGMDSPGGLAAYGHTCYVNDLPSDFAGLASGIELVFKYAEYLPVSFNEFTGYDANSGALEETYFRRIHFGALQPVMDHSPALHASPWETKYSPALLASFKYFSWLHYELVPYLHSYDWQAYETGAPILRDPDPSRFTTKLGDEIFVAYVTETGTELEKQQRGILQQFPIALPPDEWIDYWDVSRSYTGNITRPVPWGKEPIFIRRGAIIPMQVSRPYTGHGTRASEGSLTVLVYPSDKSRFRYRDDSKSRWIDIGAELAGNTLTLGASEFPSQPLLYRVERWNSPPTTVRVCGTTVMVNGPQGLAASLSEDAVNGATKNAWYYDADAKRLIVKAIP